MNFGVAGLYIYIYIYIYGSLYMMIKKIQIIICVMYIVMIDVI